MAHQHHVYPLPQQGGIPSPRPFPPSPYGGASRIQQQSHTDDASEVCKRNAVNKILETVHGYLTSMRKSREAEMEGMFNAHAVLRRREEEINVRLLSREQFFHRATAAKVKAAQMHAQVTAMAARAQPRYAT